MIHQLRSLAPEALHDFTEQLKRRVLEAVVDKIPHLEASIAVAELSVALHYVLNTPEDVLLWDVSHQAYVHKALTGRLHLLPHQREKGGISGFTKREESPYDFFGAGHASTSISALAGIGQADAISGNRRRRVAVIGDGALSGGLSFEGLNHLGQLGHDCLVIINDNDGSIDPTQGALHKRGAYGDFVGALGWNYVREDRGNDVRVLVDALQKALERKGPQVLHIRTQRPNLEPPKRYTPGTTFQWWAAQTLQRLFAEHNDLCLLSPAMLSGGGFSTLERQFPDRVLDTGINEGHCVTMAAGLAAAGGRPWVHIYSTFLQRAYDNLVHDVALQSLPVVFLVDRAGLVGADGPTHHGVFDLGFLMDVPGITVWNPMDGNELAGMLEQAAAKPLAGPLAIRYPKSTTLFEGALPFEPWRYLSQVDSNTLVVSTGWLSAHQGDLGVDHIHLAQSAPLDPHFLEALRAYDQVIVFEESTGQGGLSGAINMALCAMDRTVKLVVRKLPMDFIPHGNRDDLLRQYGLIPRRKDL